MDIDIILLIILAGSAGYIIGDFFITKMVCREFNIEMNDAITWDIIFKEIRKNR